MRYGMTKQLGGHYQAVAHCLVKDNTIVDSGRIGLFVGSSRNQDSGEKGISNIAPYSNQIVNNIVVNRRGEALKVDAESENLILDNWFYAGKDVAVSELAGNTSNDPMLDATYRPRPESPANGMGASIGNLQPGP